MTQNLLYYNVSIAAVTGAAPADGFIDNRSASSYIIPDGTDMESGWPGNVGGALAKARANLRWTQIISQLSTTVTPYAISNIIAVNGSNIAAASAMNFTVVYDRGDYLFAYDELNPGAILYNEFAVTRWIARALIANINVDNFDVLDPTASTDPTQHYGQSIQPVNAAPLAIDIPTATSLISLSFVSEVSGALEYATDDSGNLIYPY
jgi:hypothetical protein